MSSPSGASAHGLSSPLHACFLSPASPISPLPLPVDPQGSSTSDSSSATSATSPSSLSPRRKLFKREKKSVTLGQEFGVLPLPKRAGAWIDKESFSALPPQGQTVICACAALLDLYQAASEKFGDAWKWSRVAMRPRALDRESSGAAGGNEADCLDSPAQFKAALHNGKLRSYFLTHLKNSESAKAADALRFARQLHPVVAEIGELLPETLAPQGFTAGDASYAMQQLCHPKNEEWSARFVGIFYETPGKRLLVRTLGRALKDVVQVLEAGVQRGDAESGVLAPLEALHPLGTALMGYRRRELRDLLLAGQDAQKIAAMTELKLFAYQAESRRALKQMNEAERARDLAQNRERLRKLVLKNLRSEIGEEIATASRRLVARLLAGDTRFDAGQ